MLFHLNEFCLIVTNKVQGKSRLQHNFNISRNRIFLLGQFSALLTLSYIVAFNQQSHSKECDVKGQSSSNHLCKLFVSVTSQIAGEVSSSLQFSPPLAWFLQLQAELYNYKKSKLDRNNRNITRPLSRQDHLLKILLLIIMK